MLICVRWFVVLYTAHMFVLVHTGVYWCTRAYTCVSWCTVVCSGVYSCILSYVGVSSCALVQCTGVVVNSCEYLCICVLLCPLVCSQGAGESERWK